MRARMVEFNHALAIAVIVTVVALGGIYLITNTGSHAQAPTPTATTATTTTPSYSESALIVPGAMPTFSCPLMTQLPVPVAILATSGLHAYNVSGVTDYVLSPGSNATITYGFYSSLSGTTVYPNGTVVTRAHGTQPSQGTLNLNATFYHQVQVPVNYTVTVVNGSQQTPSIGVSTDSSNSSEIQNSSQTVYKLCYQTLNPGIGVSCTYRTSPPATQYAYVNVTNFTHQGIYAKAALVNTSTSIQAQSAVLRLSANSTTQAGTYWMSVGGEPCTGGQLVLLTIGTSKYSGVVSKQVFS